MSVKIKKGFVLRKIGPQYMAVPYGAMTDEVKGMISLTESGYLLWQTLDQGVDTKETLTEILLREYDVEEEDAARDVDEFVLFLEQMGVLET
ncbi:MAG: PqqD family protein [Clostridia bacterium]|nr:PqqD family protein [Clostridia bacterium]